ncbi:MAG: glycosyltransferase [Rikenellaceae bacterium]
MKTICFVTTGDIKDIATAKRALGLANPLLELGWRVSIIMEDTSENRHRVALECDDSIQLHYFSGCGVWAERKAKDRIIKEINPDYLYICAFVVRNIVGLTHSSKKLVEHSELQSRIENVGYRKRVASYMVEYFSIIYSNAIFNASKYLQELYLARGRRICRTMICRTIPMLYFPYAYNPSIVNIVDVDYVDDKFKKFKGYKNFIFLGSVAKNYGVFTILEAVKSMVSTHKGFKVLILGKGRDYEEALQYIKDNRLEEYVSMEGYVDEEDIASYFSMASSFISPMNDTIQDWARCPSKLYMYLPYCKPIISCRIGEPYQLLRGEGYYYDHGNSSQMALQIKRVIDEDGENSCVEQNRQNIYSLNHTWAKRAEEFDRWITQNRL